MMEIFPRKRVIFQIPSSPTRSGTCYQRKLVVCSTAEEEEEEEEDETLLQ
jgi:hypothetical protein